MAKPLHILDVRYFTPEFVDAIFARARDRSTLLGPLNTGPILQKTLFDRIMFNMFFEPSTRTRTSFEVAAIRTGMRCVVSENAGEFSSRAKGESDLDSFRALALYGPDVIVTRHDETGMLHEICRQLDAEGFRVPFINAGDGRGQHPTQTLLDEFTILNDLGTVEDLVIAVAGDLLNGRVPRSLVYRMAQHPRNTFIFVSPPELKMGEDIKQYLRDKGVSIEETEDLEWALARADVFYHTRIQAERLELLLGEDLQQAYDRVAGRFRLTPENLEHLKDGGIAMHPQPIVSEGASISVKRDDDTYTTIGVNEFDPDCRELAYKPDGSKGKFAVDRQLANGLPIRIALLEYVCGKL